MDVRAKILVVEDESIVALDIKKRLSGMGYTIAGIVSNGEDALRLAGETWPDLILMDIKIKGELDGIETAERIRARQDIPVVFLTAFADDATLRRAKVTGPSGYILKPFEERELAICIEMALYKHKMEKELRESEERYMLALRGANDGIWDWDLQRGVIYYSPRWKEMIGYQDGEIGNQPQDWFSHIHPEDQELVQLALSHHLDGLTSQVDMEHRMFHKDGSIHWMRTRGLAITNGNGRPHRIAGSQSDITALKQAQEQLVHDAYHDTLTGLPNRALFLDRLERAMERRKRRQEETLAVLFLDLDQFKVVNDSLGHLAGDRLLRDIAQRLHKLVRSSDTVARLGGDEFVVLLEAANSVAYACNVAERILEVINAPARIQEREIATSASIGIVMVTDDHQQPMDVLRDADIAMYRAKSLGKSRYEVFDVHLRQRATERLELENLLSGALKRGDFRLHYQPIYSLTSRRIVGLEALLRLYPQGSQSIPPVVFIPVAEEMGLIRQIGEWVLREACQKMADWHKRYPEGMPLNLHVNISGRQLSSRNFVDQVAQVLETSGMDARWLKLEITETVLIENIEQVTVTLDQLKALGVSLQIDDFGTGYSSLGYIRRFPIDTIKIDRKFISPMDRSERNTEVVRAVLTLANQLGLDTVAEGIETEEQEAQLKEMQCHFGQGFLFSKPLDTASLENLLDRCLVEVEV